MDEKHLNDWLKKRKDRRENLTASSLFDGIINHSVASLSSSITLLESTLKSDQEIAKSLIKKCIPLSGKSIRIGITGVPGVGKSTFIESFGKELIKEGKKVAVLAIDPSSEISGGSILGDKTRMEEFSVLENVFIRPSPAGKSLGGVAQKTRESIILCEAAGFDVIIIETVGVGQSSTMVHSMVDFFLLLMLSGAGDELQGIKRGIMEMADSIVITKADGENLLKAKLASQEYKNALHLFPANENDWIPKSFICSAYSGLNIIKTLEIIYSYINHTKLNGWFDKKRDQQDEYWFYETLKEMVFHHFFDDHSNKIQITKYIQEISTKKISSIQAAEEIFNLYVNNKNGTNI
jgi:LAO/AO transport system kinase